MDVGELFGGLFGVLAALVLFASFVKVGQTRTQRAVIGWNVARVVSLLVLCWWVAVWLPARFA